MINSSYIYSKEKSLVTFVVNPQSESNTIMKLIFVVVTVKM